MNEIERLTKLVELYRAALVKISEQEEIEGWNGDPVPSVEMSIAINALENGKGLEK